MTTRRSVVAALLSALLICPMLALAGDCYDEAADFHGVNPWVLRGITYVESGYKDWVVNRNANGTVDVGRSQINSIHFPVLARYGISPRDLHEPCKAIYVAAWMLRQKMQKHGNSWTAVGAYHSETPHLRDAYAGKVKRVVDGWIKAGVVALRPARLPGGAQGPRSIEGASQAGGR